MGKATADLKKEHEAILHVLNILEKMTRNNFMDTETLLDYYDEVVYFLKIFADKCHHGKEENYLFTELVNKGIPQSGGPVGVMLEEHEEGRMYISIMSESVKARDIEAFKSGASKYTNLLRNHIEKENTILFAEADKLISEDEQNNIFLKFEEYEETVIGSGVHDKLHLMIHTWAEVFAAE